MPFLPLREVPVFYLLFHYGEQWKVFVPRQLHPYLKFPPVMAVAEKGNV